MAISPAQRAIQLQIHPAHLIYQSVQVIDTIQHKCLFLLFIKLSAEMWQHTYFFSSSAMQHMHKWYNDIFIY